MIHSEFLKYPESRDTIETGLEAYENYLNLKRKSRAILPTVCH